MSTGGSINHLDGFIRLGTHQHAYCFLLESRTHHVGVPHVVSLESLEALVGLNFGDVADITHENLFRDSMFGTEFTAAASILGLTVESGDLVDRDGFFLVGV